MWLKITLGLGGRRGVIALVITVLVGIILFLLAWVVRLKLVSPPPQVPAAVQPEEVLRLGEQARGPMPEVVYTPKDLARVASFAVAKRADGSWRGLPAGSVLEVTAATVKGKDLWVTGLVQGGLRREEVTVHASFLERYQPLPLNQTVELSDVRLVHLAEKTPAQLIVTGWLRNITGQTLSQCVVVCVFQDKDGHNLDRQVSQTLLLPPLEFVRFETAPTELGRAFAAITLEISHATPDGLRNYLPSVVIPRGVSAP
jgi:hypothetical protein